MGNASPQIQTSLIRWHEYKASIVTITIIGLLAVADPVFSWGGCTSSQKCYYFANLLPKTAWKWKNLDPWGRVPGAPPRSANDLEANDFHDTMQLCNLLKWHMRCFVTALQRSSVVSVHQSVSQGGEGAGHVTIAHDALDLIERLPWPWHGTPCHGPSHLQTWDIGIPQPGPGPL